MLRASFLIEQALPGETLGEKSEWLLKQVILFLKVHSEGRNDSLSTCKHFIRGTFILNNDW